MRRASNEPALLEPASEGRGIDSRGSPDLVEGAIPRQVKEHRLTGVVLDEPITRNWIADDHHIFVCHMAGFDQFSRHFLAGIVVGPRDRNVIVIGPIPNACNTIVPSEKRLSHGLRSIP